MATALTLIWGPRYDLAWTREQVVWVAQVKSISQTEERQLRTDAGQVLRYRQKLIANGHEVQDVIITSRPEPGSVRWDVSGDRARITARGTTRPPRSRCVAVSGTVWR